MEKTNKFITGYIFTSLIIFCSLFLVFYIFDTTLAFTGPSTNPYSNYGLIKADGYRASIGSTDPRATSSLIISGADSGSANFSLIVEDALDNPLLKIRNDRVVGFGKNLVIKAPNDPDITHGYAEPYYLFQPESLRAASITIGYPGFSLNSNKNALFTDGWYVSDALSGIEGFTSDIRNFKSIQADVINPPDVMAERITGFPSSTGVFGELTGGGTYAFPFSLGVNTTSILEQQEDFNVQGDAYVSRFLGIGKIPSVSLDIAGDGTANGRVNIRYSPTEATYGQIYGGTNGVVLSARNASANYGLHFYTSNVDSEVEQMRITTAGVGIGVFPPTAKLDVAGTVKTTGFQLTTGAQSGYVLQSDLNGVASWAAIQGPPSGTSGQTLYHNGSNWAVSSLLYNNGTSIGVGTTSIDADTLLKIEEGGYLQFGKTSAGNPNNIIPGDCDSSSETGRLVLDINDSGLLYICNGPARSWDNLAYWYDPSWSSRKQINIDRTKVSGSLSNFPVFIDTAAPAAAQDDCDDILFTSSDGITKLDHQIEKDLFETTACASGNTIVAWIRTPSLSSSAATTLYMYYGNSSVADQQNATAVWDSNFKAVWHLQEISTDESAILNKYQDSTINNFDADQVRGDDIATNWLRGVNLDGSSDFGNRSYASALDQDDVTMSGWVMFSSLIGSSNRGIIARSNANDAYNILIDYSSDTINYYVRKGTGWSIATPTPSVVSTGQWYYVVLTHTANTLRGYLNGQLIGSQTSSTAVSRANSSFYFGHYGGGGTINGYIDEFRISNVARSDDWILTEYNNQNSPSTFYTVSGENEY